MTNHTPQAVSSVASDWPGSGPIDLEIHDRPHRSSTTEWWYLNTHLTAANGRSYSVFAAFFALAIDQDPVTRANKYAYSIEWALVDVETQRYVYDSVLDRSATDVGMRRIDKGEGVRDKLFGRALRETFAKGKVPLPDRMFEREPRVAWDRLALDFDGNTLRKLDDGRYEMVLARRDGQTGCSLVFTPTKRVVRHGDDGVVRGVSSEHMFYYFTPSCDVVGSVTVDGERVDARGRGWYDHEFGKQVDESEKGSIGDVAWNWVSAQLEDGWELSLYQLFEVATKRWLPESGVIAIAPDGSSERIEDYTLTPIDEWTSTLTFNSYPTRWSLSVPKLGLELTLDAEFGGQEFVTIISPPAFWEGRIRIHGMRNGGSIRGLGFIERSGFSKVDTIDGFFSAVGRATRSAVQALLPEKLTRDDLTRLTGAPGVQDWTAGVDTEQLTRTMIRPIREIVDRGGKTWRSYGLLACIDAVGGDSAPFREWLALPELVHVGSLIVDDVQDHSDVRRGGPTAHKVHGDALAINAGCVAYFISELTLHSTKLTDAQRVDVYRWYFAAMRAAHMGQALDIDGLRPLVPGVVEGGDAAALERRLHAAHTLKAAAAPSALARAAVAMGGGTTAQSEALGRLFEAYGLAFQIIDDVLNLKGFDGALKTRGEDITEGKVTAPVLKALGRLPFDQRRALWDTIEARPTDVATVAGAIETITACGAIDACEREARDLVESAWAAVDPVIPESFAKAKLRAFGWFVLDRHY